MTDAKTETKKCPICGRTYTGRPALSRKDDATPICPDCGARQSLAAAGITGEKQEKILELIRENFGRNEA